MNSITHFSKKWKQLTLNTYIGKGLIFFVMKKKIPYQKSLPNNSIINEVYKFIGIKKK